MIRTILLAASALALVACLSTTPEESSSTDGGSVVACACPGQSIVWTTRWGTPNASYRTTVDGCAKVTVDHTVAGASQPNVSCWADVAACGGAGLVTTNDLAQALGEPDVKAALAKAKGAAEPPLYGRVVYELPATLEVTVDGATIRVGKDCGDAAGCTPIPSGMAQLGEKLSGIDGTVLEGPNCAVPYPSPH